MLERILLSIALGLALVGNGYQWWGARTCHQEGRAAERAIWESVVEDRNAQIRILSGDLSRAFDAAEYARDAAIAEANGQTIPALPPEIVAACSLPDAVRTPLNRLAGGS